jgi:phage shock protein C
LRVNGRLTRSRNSMIGGVAAGVAEWINADPALVRIAWALLVPLTNGAALLAYGAAWAVLPEAPRDAAVDTVGEAGEATDAASSPVAAETPRDEGRAALLVGGGLVFIGLWFFVREYLPDIDWGFVWPLLLIGVGVAILVGTMRRR